MTERQPEKDRWDGVTRYAPYAAVAVLVLGAVIMAVRVGVPAAILWFGFAALAGAILLFWEALRSVVDPDATQGEAGEEALAGEAADLDARKRGAVKALRDLEFEHSIGRMSDEDYNMLRDKYRGEARAAMEAIDRGLGAFLDEAKKMVAAASVEALGGEHDAKPVTANGETENAVDEDALDDKAGEPVDASVAPATDADEVVAANERTCASCGTKNDPDAVFCKRCATRFEESAT